MYFVKYKEQELPIIVDFAVIKSICNKLNIKLSEFETIVENPEHTEKLFWESIKRGSKLEGKELLIKESEVEDVLSETYADFLLIFQKSVLKMFSPSINGDDSKKLNTNTPKERKEITYDYLLSLFVANFNYTVTDFDLLTPVQAYTILDTKRNVEESKYDFLRSEFRVLNYFTLKSSMGDTSSIHSPSDLYHLSIDDLIKESYRKKLENYVPDVEFIDWANDYLAKHPN